ncbi:thioredoxin family protein [Pseudochryseolinea flava]|uniref:Thioredoxin family protein n=1 Tax=Pseudochryseolinea flava TaxID=2059302 RepID=A0A364Y6S8_9BACT|nr:thioredoxin family protein [Pseudochryseolinea flava]RAW02640.1 hypothetical protein DQQ10_00580 [Pseudochryseolinea flava]
MKYILSCVFLFVCAVANAQSFTNAKEAFKTSAETGKPVLLVFSGSDWCAPCVEFDKNVMQQDSFTSFADQSLVVLKADFPQRKVLSAELQAQNEELATQYNPKGIFPLLLLVRGDRSLIATVPFKHQNADSFITSVKRLLSSTP